MKVGKWPATVLSRGRTRETFEVRLSEEPAAEKGLRPRLSGAGEASAWPACAARQVVHFSDWCTNIGNVADGNAFMEPYFHWCWANLTSLEGAGKRRRLR